MKKGMFFLTAMLLVISVLCQPLLAVHASYVVYVCTDDGYLNIRTGPSNKADIVSELADCQSFEVMKTEGNWAYGDHYNSEGGLTQGWIYLPYTKSTYEAARDNAGKAVNRTVVVQSYEGDGYMNLRWEPTTGNFHNELCQIDDGTVLTITRIVQRKGTSGWGLTRYNGQQGWIYLKGVKDYVPTPEPTPTPVPTLEPTVTPAPTVAPVTPTHYPTGLQTGTVTIENDRIISNQMLVLILIAVAIFLVVTVAILLVVVLNRSKQSGDSNTYEQQPYYPQEEYEEPYPEENYEEQPYEEQPYEELPYEEQPEENGDDAE